MSRLYEENPFALDVVSVRLVRDAPLYSDQPLLNPEAVLAVLGDVMCEFDREVIAIVNLKSDLTPINVTFASMGAINEAVAHPREMLKASLLSNAAAMMIVHNHPSGQLSPSNQDTMMTDRMNNICNLMDITLVDSIIVGGDNQSYFSFCKKGLLKRPDIRVSTDYKELDMQNFSVAEQVTAGSVRASSLKRMQQKNGRKKAGLRKEAR